MTYYGITIGPILETLGQATTPASLWYSSYMFSELTRTICEQLTEITHTNPKYLQIISPYYKGQDTNIEVVESNDSNDNSCVGYGKYHDRILFCLSDETPNSIREEIEGILSPFTSDKKTPLKQLISHICEDLERDMEIKKNRKAKQNKGKHKSTEMNTDFLNSYLQVKYITIQADDPMITLKEGVINALNYYLDCLELSRNIFTQEEDHLKGENIFQKLFYNTDVTGHKHSQNAKIKDCYFVKQIEDNEDKTNFSLFDGKNIRELEDIAKNSEMKKIDNLRKYQYFAIVQADGDNMGKYITKLGSDCEKNGLNLISEMHTFSRKCMEYTTKSADLIKDYGGTVIFAGGDDLLFLAPIQPSEKDNIYTLIQKISNLFEATFAEEIKKQKQERKEAEKLALSFGVSINRVKFPLYEAFRSSRDLLFGKAKAAKTKNNIAVSLRKGNSVTFGVNMRLSSCVFQNYIELIREYYTKVDDEELQRLNSVIYLFENWGEMFARAFEGSDTVINNLFKNIFDSNIHEYKEKFLEDIKQFAKCVYCQTKNGTLQGINEKEETRNEGIQNIIALLQMAKFLVEKDIEEE